MTAGAWRALKEEGDCLMQEGKCAESLSKYSASLETLGDDQDSSEERKKLYSNKSLAGNTKQEA